MCSQSVQVAVGKTYRDGMGCKVSIVREGCVPGHFWSDSGVLFSADGKMLSQDEFGNTRARRHPVFSLTEEVATCSAIEDTNNPLRWHVVVHTRWWIRWLMHFACFIAWCLRGKARQWWIGFIMCVMSPWMDRVNSIVFRVPKA
jgi:hypothetical protein